MNARHITWTMVLCAALLLPLRCATARAAEQAIPLQLGLTIVSAVNESGYRGDYETILSLLKRTPDAVDYRISAENRSAAGELGTVQVDRRVLEKDRLASHLGKFDFHDGDPLTFDGSTPGVSVAMLKELKTTGSTTFTLIKTEVYFGTAIEQHLDGTLRRDASAPATFGVLLNDKATALPVIRATGELSDGADTLQLSVDILDDPGNPLVLRKQIGDIADIQVLRIRIPNEPGKPAQLEQDLAQKRKSEIYGIYFAFNSARIRPESGPTLTQIAQLMRAHPDWQLRLDGHTDNIGGDAANLALSRRRAAAVKDALVAGYQIEAARLTTGGFGAAAPIDTNKTLAGRARNRRVELQRE